MININALQESEIFPPFKSLNSTSLFYIVHKIPPNNKNNNVRTEMGGGRLNFSMVKHSKKTLTNIYNIYLELLEG